MTDRVGYFYLFLAQLFTHGEHALRDCAQDSEQFDKKTKCLSHKPSSLNPDHTQHNTQPMNKTEMKKKRFINDLAIVLSHFHSGTVS